MSWRRSNPEQQAVLGEWPHHSLLVAVCGCRWCHLGVERCHIQGKARSQRERAEDGRSEALLRVCTMVERCLQSDSNLSGMADAPLNLQVFFTSLYCFFLTLTSVFNWVLCVKPLPQSHTNDIFFIIPEKEDIAFSSNYHLRRWPLFFNLQGIFRRIWIWA